MEKVRVKIPLEYRASVDNLVNDGLLSFKTIATGRILVWTEKAKKQIAQNVRTIVLCIFGNRPCPQDMIAELKEYGFDEKGFYNGKL